MDSIFLKGFRTLSAIIISFILFMFPLNVCAHASLVSATPAMGEHLQTSPGNITLTFNERLEKTQYGIEVLNDHGESLTHAKAKMSTNQRKLILQLPHLKKGIYTVTYNVISEDGHPVKSAYVFTVGSGFDNLPAAQQPVNIGTVHEEYPGFWQLRIFYFISLVIVSGWIIWRSLLSIIRPQSIKGDATAGRLLLFVFLLALLGFGISQFSALVGTVGWNDVQEVLTGTAAGWSWLLSMLLLIASFFILFRNRWVDLVWAALLLLLKSLNGHAFAADQQLLAIMLDWVHLLASAVWAGGLLYILQHWRQAREEMRAYLAVFSRIALISIAVLALTGTLSLLQYVPSISLLDNTLWGQLMIVKIIAVVMVIVVGAIIRWQWRRNREIAVSRWMMLDMSTALVILGIVGVLTYLSPLPPNTPFTWHHSGKSHLTVQISPNAPGVNQFIVMLWQPKNKPAPQSVQLLLKYRDRKVPPIEVPLKDVAIPDQNAIISKEFLYKAKGPYLPWAGDYTVELRMTDSSGTESVFQSSMTIYPTKR